MTLRRLAPDGVCYAVAGRSQKIHLAVAGADGYYTSTLCGRGSVDLVEWRTSADLCGECAIAYVQRLESEEDDGWEVTLVSPASRPIEDGLEHASTRELAALAGVAADLVLGAGTVDDLERPEPRELPRFRAGLSGLNRRPYVGEGADGCRRSARIDREEADVAGDEDRRATLLESAERWEAQALEIEARCPVCYGGGVLERDTEDGPEETVCGACGGSGVREGQQP